MSDPELDDFLDQFSELSVSPVTDCSQETVCFGRHAGLRCTALVNTNMYYSRRIAILVAEGRHKSWRSPQARRQAEWLADKARNSLSTSVTERVIDGSLDKILALGSPKHVIDHERKPVVCRELQPREIGIVVDTWLHVQVGSHFDQTHMDSLSSEEKLREVLKESLDYNWDQARLADVAKALLPQLEALEPIAAWLRDMSVTEATMRAMDRSPGVVGLRGKADFLSASGRIVIEVKHSDPTGSSPESIAGFAREHEKQLAMYGALYNAEELVLVNAATGVIKVWTAPQDLRTNLAKLV